MTSPFTFWLNYLNKGLINQDRNKFSSEVIPENASYLGVEFYKPSKKDVYIEQTADYIILKSTLLKDLGLSDQISIEGDEKYLFLPFLKKKLKSEIENTKAQIETLYLTTKSTDSSSIENKLNKILKLLKEHKHSHFDVMKCILEEFQECINQYFKEENPQLKQILSFNIDTNILGDENLKELYNKLIEPPSLIKASELEFRNAFTGKKVIEGVNWCSLHRNHSNKKKLFEFLQGLIDKKIIPYEDYSTHRSRVAYVFRNQDGGFLKNLKSSHNTFLDNPPNDLRIKEILQTL